MILSSFQKPSRYINREINAVHKDAPVKVALLFPDLYEIGMSHLGLKILYKIINDIPFASAERVFSPWTDLEIAMKKNNVLLSSLESKRPLPDFDIIGFSLQYELSYTTVLNMLHLGGIPFRTEDRLQASPLRQYPLIIAGGPCTVNPMPMSPFIDAFLVGDGEEAIREILDTYHSWKTEGDGSMISLLLALSGLKGMYVPYVHDSAGNTQTITRRILQSLDNAPYPDKPVVPYTNIVHDRINIEVSRGCSMGCRFCQAGMIYRPVRERSPARVFELAEQSLKNTGHEEVALTSLSAGDYSCLPEVLRELNKRFSKDRIALSLPSLRVAALNRDILREIRSVRKTGFTIAPEAGTERLRKVINKDFSDDDYEQTLRMLFEEGWLNLKLYFMIGLPTETDEDIEAISEMAIKALKTAKKFTNRFVNINVGVSPFVPKAHTPFQWFGQNPPEELSRKKARIKKNLNKKGLNVKGHDVDMSLLEAAFARGDRRLAPLLEKAWSLGCRLDGWSDIFNFQAWKKAMDLTGINPADFAGKTFSFSEELPWEKIHIGVTKDFQWREYQHALSGIITSDCRKTCHGCGLDCKKPDISLQQEFVPDVICRSERPDIRLHKQFKTVRIRVEFSKTAELRNLSHLELVTLILRTLRRAGFPLEYTKGFHPFPKVSFGPPLGVGIAGLSEYFDMEVTPPFDLEMQRKKLNSMLPEGVYVSDMSVVPTEGTSLNSFITRYEYRIKGGDFSSVRKFLSKKEITAQRHGREINLRNMVEEERFLDKDTVQLILVDQEDNKVRLGELLPAVFNSPMENLDVTRVALYGWKSGWIKPLERSFQWTAKF